MAKRCASGKPRSPSGKFRTRSSATSSSPKRSLEISIVGTLATPRRRVAQSDGTIQISGLDGERITQGLWQVGLPPIPLNGVGRGRGSQRFGLGAHRMFDGFPIGFETLKVLRLQRFEALSASLLPVSTQLL